MPHGPGHCKGATKGLPFNVRPQCRVCWNKLNPQVGSSIVTVATAPPVVKIDREPCVHLGPIIESAPHPCDRHVYDCAIHDRCKTYDWKSKPLACCVGCKDDPRNQPIPDVTIAITHWNRPEALKRLLDSIRVYLPSIPVAVEDTGGNLSAGRNRLYAKVQTKYLIMMEEDFVALPQTAQGIRDAVTILNTDNTVSGVSGIAWEPARGPVRWGHDLKRFGNVIRPTPSTRPLRHVENIKYRPCDLVLNWGVFRTELFRQVQWDEDFPIQEHQLQFWRMNQAGHQFAFYAPLRINHLRDRPTKHYTDNRYRSFAHLVKQKYGFTFGREV